MGKGVKHDKADKAAEVPEPVMSCPTFLLARRSFLLSWRALWLSVSRTTSKLQNPSTCLESGQTFLLTATAAWLLPFSPTVQPNCDVTLTKCATDLGVLSFCQVHDPLSYYMAESSSHLFLPCPTLYWSSVAWALSCLGCGNGLLQQQPLDRMGVFSLALHHFV